MKHPLTLGRRSLLAGLASAALLPSFVVPAALADPFPASFSGTFTASGASAPFMVYQRFMKAAFTFASGTVGTITLTRSIDGRASWTPIKSGSQSLSAVSRSAVFAFRDPTPGVALWRVECSLTSGSVLWLIDVAEAALTGVSPNSGMFGGILTSSGVLELANVYPTRGFVLKCPIFRATNASIALTRYDTIAKAWVSAIAAQTSPFNIAFMPDNPPSAYRLEYTITTGSLPWQIEFDRQHDGGFAESGLILDATPGKYDSAYQQACWQYLQDSDLAGSLTLYKVCAGNTFAKLSVPAAARRLKGRQFWRGNLRDIRAEYADVASVVDGSGNPVTSAASQTDTQTTYAPGNRVTYRDASGGAYPGPWSGEFMCTAFPLGIYGYPTLIEAVQGPSVDRSAGAAMPNLAAISAALG